MNGKACEEADGQICKGGAVRFAVSAAIIVVVRRSRTSLLEVHSCEFCCVEHATSLDFQDISTNLLISSRFLIKYVYNRSGITQ